MNDDSLGAGLQMALFDVVGKILEPPVHQLIGTKVRDWTPISWWCIDASPEAWAAEAKDPKAQMPFWLQLVGNGLTWRDLFSKAQKQAVRDHWR